MTRPLALVTGGVRRLGAVIAARLADAGYDLALSSHGDATPDPVLADAIARNGCAWQHFSADLSDSIAASALVGDVATHFGRAPDLLVNNAAMFGQDGWQAMDAASLDAHFRLNLFAPLLLSTALVKANGNRPGSAVTPCTRAIPTFAVTRSTGWSPPSVRRWPTTSPGWSPCVLPPTGC